MRKGTIKRPVGTKEPIIRLVGDADLHIIDDTVSMEMHDLRTDWDDILDILHDMFSERARSVKGERRHRSLISSVS